MLLSLYTEEEEDDDDVVNADKQSKQAWHLQVRSAAGLDFVFFSLSSSLLHPYFHPSLFL